MQAHDFSQELAAFEKRKSELLDVCEGKFAVSKADQYLGTFDTYLAAYEAGLKAWGNVSFLVKEVLREERSETMPGVLGLIHAGS
jgi:hypothetical protein